MPARIEHRNLTKLRKIEYVVSEDVFLLPMFELRVPDLSPNGCEHPMAIVEIQLYLFSDLLGDCLVSQTDRPLRALGGFADGYESVDEKRKNRRRRDEQNEAAGDPFHR